MECLLAKDKRKTSNPLLYWRKRKLKEHLRICPTCRKTFDRLVYAKRLLESGGDVHSLKRLSDFERKQIKNILIQLLASES